VQPAGQLRVFAQVPATPGGPLHGPEQDPVVAALEEQLRAGAGDGEAPEVQEGVVRPALTQGEVPVEPERVAPHPPGHPDRQVALIGVPRRDAVTNPGDVTRVPGRRPRRTPLGIAGRVSGLVQGWHRRRLVAEPEPDQGHSQGRGRVHGEVRVQPRSRLVRDVPEGPEPGVRRPLDLGQDAHDLVGALGHEHPVGRRTPHGGPRPEVVEAGPRHGCATSAEDDGAVLVEEHPPFAVPTDRPGQGRSLGVLARCRQGARVVGVVDADHLLLDDAVRAASVSVKACDAGVFPI
jgi:hypothetical protein